MRSDADALRDQLRVVTEQRDVAERQLVELRAAVLAWLDVAASPDHGVSPEEHAAEIEMIRLARGAATASR